MKTKTIILGGIAVALGLLTACEKQIGPITEFDGDWSEIDADRFETIVNPDGSVLVESDNGYNVVNNLWKAINQYGDSLVTVTSTGEQVQCNNVFILQRGGHYYVEGKCVLKKNVLVKAEDGPGDLPIIQPMADETGASAADAIRIEANVEFNNIWFLQTNAVTGALQERMFRVDGKGCRVTIDHCVADYCKNFFFYLKNKNSEIILTNSIFRNMKYNCSSNGRLVDTRGSNTKLVKIHNCIVYHNLGAIVRYDGCTIDEVEITNNTFYNCGTCPEVTNAKKVTIENNIYANVGWREAAKAQKEDGSITKNFFKVDDVTDVSKVKISICNNNVYQDSRMHGLYTKYATEKTAWEPEPLTLSTGMQHFVDAGVGKFDGNFSEVLEFDKAPIIEYDAFLDVYFSNPDAPDEVYTDLPWFAKEDNVNGASTGVKYSFKYPSTSRSATASTTGGPIGAQL